MEARTAQGRGSDRGRGVAYRMWGRLGRALTLRSARLASGLVLFAYVGTHLVNHALGNISLAAMEAGLDLNRGLWRFPPMSVALYGALLVHAGLALWSLYARPRTQWTATDVVQLGLGLALPFLLVGHVVGTRVAHALYDTLQGYAQQLYIHWVSGLNLRQVAALLVAWAHGCLGLYRWLRLRPWFPAWAPALLCAAVLIPVLSLLGFVQGGRAVAALAADESWRIENLPQGPTESPAAAARVATLRAIDQAIQLGLLALIGLALVARGFRYALEHRRGLVRITYANGAVARVPRGTSVLAASRIARVPHASVCGGRGRCSTCRVKIFDAEPEAAPPPSAAERAVLERIRAGPGVRLACQLKPAADLSVAPLIAPHAALAAARRVAGAMGEERFVIAMFVDMRGSTRFAEQHLPFDTVFVINRFLDALTRAVTKAGGAPNQFLGDGLLALFGLGTGREAAARQALAALAEIGREIAALNELMAQNLPEPISFGIGVHGGTAILGEIGSRETGQSVFTAIGDPVNVAARLQSMTKRVGCEALVSEAVFRAAAVDPLGAAIEMTIEGRTGGVTAYALPRALDAEGLTPSEPKVAA